MLTRYLYRLLASTLILYGHSLQAQSPDRVPQQLTLETAQSMLGSHPRVLAQRLLVEVERGDLIDVQKYANPTFSFESDGLVLDSSRGPFWDRLQPSFVVRQPILTSGKRGKRVAVESADTEIASIEVQDLVRQLHFAVKRAYFGVVLAQTELRTAGDILEQFRDVVDLTRTRFSHGEISGAELRRIEAAEYVFFEDLVAAEVQLDNAKVDLLATLGTTNLGQDFEAIDSFDPAFVPPPIEKLEDIAIRQRPDLAAGRARVNRSDSVIELEKAVGKPDINTIFGYQRELDSSGPVFGVEIPLFVFNRNQGRVSRAKADRLREAELVRLRETEVLRDVRMARFQLNGFKRRIEALQGQYLEKAQQSRDITESAYRLGAASLIEFLDAERTYRETIRIHNQALFNFQLSRAQLEFAIGEDLP